MHRRQIAGRRYAAGAAGESVAKEGRADSLVSAVDEGLQRDRKIERERTLLSLGEQRGGASRSQADTCEEACHSIWNVFEGSRGPLRLQEKCLLTVYFAGLSILVFLTCSP